MLAIYVHFISIHNAICLTLLMHYFAFDSFFFPDRVFFSTFIHTISRREYQFVGIFFLQTFSVAYLCRLFCLIVFRFGVEGLWSMFRKWSWIAFKFADLMISGIIVSSYFVGIITDFKLHSQICLSRHLNQTHITWLCLGMRIKH